MSRKHFSALLFITFLVAMAVLLLPSRTGQESGLEKTALIPELAEAVNEVDWLRVTGAGNEVIATLRREDDRWVVQEHSDYRADWDKLKQLLTDLSRAEIAEPKTANPAYYDRLGVEDVDSAEAGGVLLEFSEASGLPGVIVGQSAQGRNGQYVRVLGAGQSVLLDRRLSVPRDSAGWLDKDVVDVGDAEVVEFEIEHSDGERVLARKVSVEDENFALQGLPEGREIQSAWTVDSLANSLAALTLDEVASDDTIDWTEATRFRLLTVDGLQVQAELVAVEGEDADSTTDDAFWIRLEAGTYTTAVERIPEQEEEAVDPSERASAINGRVAGWAYRIPKYKFDSMTKRMDDLLKEEETS